MTWEQIFFDGWGGGTLKAIICAPILYALVVLFIRLSGKRSASQMNNFDWIVTVALGSIMASGIVLKDVTIVECASAIGVLLVMQWIVTRAVRHSGLVQKLVKAEPRIVVQNGQYIEAAMHDERLTRQEIEAALRHNGFNDVTKAALVILETDASLSVIKHPG